MRNNKPSDKQVLFTVVLAFLFWYLTFVVKWTNFWLSMSLAVTVLTGLSFMWGGSPLKKSDFTISHALIGIGSAAVLYGVFWTGNLLSQAIFHFAKPEITSIYGIRHEGDRTIIALVLLFLTSPGEELFWRAFLQGWAKRRFGDFRGWLVAAAIYGAVHILSGNVMLTLAAFTAGLFWGYLYWRSGSIFACIVSHALWTVSIFILWPVL